MVHRWLGYSLPRALDDIHHGILAEAGFAGDTPVGIALGGHLHDLGRLKFVERPGFRKYTPIFAAGSPPVGIEPIAMKIRARQPGRAYRPVVAVIAGYRFRLRVVLENVRAKEDQAAMEPLAVSPASRKAERRVRKA